MPSDARTLETCPAVVYITYTPAPGETARGYEPWLRTVDNPFFNSIPGIRHYANWQVERVLSADPLDYTYIDFLGLESTADLERVWFNPDLDRFRHEWVRLWGYSAAIPLPIHAHAFLLRPVQRSATTPTPFARVTGGPGQAPPGFDLAWQVDETIQKHFALKTDAPWRQPAAGFNPLGHDWIGLHYGDSLDAWSPADHAGGETYVARLLASPTLSP